MDLDYPVLGSTLLFTLLSLIGLVFFIRAAVKDRTQQLKVWVTDPENGPLDQLKDYLATRSYRLSQVDPERQAIAFEGYVQPSVFLTIFLSTLAALGLLCLALVLSVLFPRGGSLYFFLLWLAPLAGGFYWQKAGRQETVTLEVGEPTHPDHIGQYPLIITAHRDELRNLQAEVSLDWVGEH